jgi:hypothetical protein
MIVARKSEKKYEGYQFTTEIFLLNNNMLYVHNSADPKHLIMDEFHKIPYVGHSSYQKLIITIRQLYY